MLVFNLPPDNVQRYSTNSGNDAFPESEACLIQNRRNFIFTTFLTDYPGHGIDGASGSDFIFPLIS